MSNPVKIIGVPISPYVRKVLAVLSFKGIAYEIDPVTPFFGDARFTSVSPLRRIPVYQDDRVTLCDSSVICQYLEDRWPSPALYPQDIAERAQSRWIEEYADTRIGDVFIWKLFNNAVIGPAIFGTPRDKDMRQRAIDNDLPDIMNYLEARAPEAGFFFGGLGIADLSVAPLFANLAFARVDPDWNRWPRTGAWLKRVMVETDLGRLAELAGRFLVAMPDQHRFVATEAGFNVTPTTMMGDRPVKGPMSL